MKELQAYIDLIKISILCVLKIKGLKINEIVPEKESSILVSNPSFLNLISLQLNHKFFGLKTSTKIWEIYKFWNCLFYTMLFLHNIKFDLERKYMQKNEPKAIVFWLFFLILSLRIKILQSLMKANFYRVQFRNVESSQ